jgi:hypothetical protein
MQHESNPQLELAFNFLQYTNQNVFLTGKAGTGKTTFLQDLKLKSPKRMVVVAPTGVAAINAGGVTIHSFFQMSFGPHIPYEPQNNRTINHEDFKRFSREKVNIIRSLDLLVIDEISMVRADLLDGIDEVLRRYKNRYKPFGGVQLLMIGDLQQLAPIVKDDEWSILKNYYDTCFFFSCHALRKSRFVGIELNHIFRQNDQHFIDLLNKVRLNQLDETARQELNKRYIPNFHPDEKEGYIVLTTHNYQSKNINDSKLNQLEAKSHLFLAEVTGEFPDYSYPTDPELELKVGAQVMFIKNDLSGDKLFFNGKIGKITSIGGGTIEIKCPGDETTISVGKMEWENCRYILDENTQEIKEEIIGVFKQYPLKLAWAITIHKSQGLTFEKAIIDARESFAHGQVYVALSRCKTLEGLVLSTRIGEFSIKNDTTVVQFSDNVEKNQPGSAELEKSRKDYIQELLLDLFDFKPLLRQINYILKIWDEHASNMLGNLETTLKSMVPALQTELINIAGKFEPQLRKLIDEYPDPQESAPLQDRIKKASEYFCSKFESLILQPLSELYFETDNKAVKKRFRELIEKFKMETEVKKACLEFCKNGFEATSFLETRSKASIDTPEKTISRKVKEEPRFISRYPDFYYELKKWRQRKADVHNVEPARILPQKSLRDIADQLPATVAGLKSIKGMGGTRIKEFGKDILLLIIAYRKEKGMEIPFDAEKSVERAVMDSKTTSFSLFNEGKSIVEIASERKMSVSTIESHLTYFVGTGELELDRLIPSSESKALIKYIEENQPQSMTDTYNAFQSKYTFSQIRFVMKYLETTRENV